MNPNPNPNIQRLHDKQMYHDIESLFYAEKTTAMNIIKMLKINKKNMILLVPKPNDIICI